MSEMALTLDAKMGFPAEPTLREAAGQQFSQI